VVPTICSKGNPPFWLELSKHWPFPSNYLIGQRPMRSFPFRYYWSDYRSSWYISNRYKLLVSHWSYFWKLHPVNSILPYIILAKTFQQFLTRVASVQPFMVWVWIWKISPKNFKFFNFFPSGQKKSLWVGSESTRVKGGLASYLLRVKTKLGSGQGPSLL